MTTTNIAAAALGCLLLFVVYAATIFGLDSPNALSRQYMAEPSLVVVGIFKNEAEGLAEWCKHYLKMQGVKQLYLIDNNSTDAWPAAVAPYKQNVTVVSRPLPHAQVDHYNSLLAPLLKEKHADDWVFVLGIDDFLYPPSVHRSTIASVVRANSYFWTHRGTVVYFNTTNPHYTASATYSTFFLIAVTAAVSVLLCIANKQCIIRQLEILPI